MGLGKYDELISCQFAANRVSGYESDDTLAVAACDRVIVQIKAKKSQGSDPSLPCGYCLSTYTFLQLPGGRGRGGGGGRRLVLHLAVIPPPPCDSEDSCAPGAAASVEPPETRVAKPPEPAPLQPLFVKFVFDEIDDSSSPWSVTRG
jgi:hypothetical protein